jgi:Ca-activated chloride channel homolog
MKIRALIVWASVGMAASSAVAMAVPMHRAGGSGSGITKGGDVTAQAGTREDASHFTAGNTLLVDARLGHRSIARGSDGKTFLFASIAGVEKAATTAPPLDLAIAIDRSGSMSGKRIVNAIEAARTAVARLRDGDAVSIVAFDTRAEVIVPYTQLGSASRASIDAAIRSIMVGGDTCISCGLVVARQELDRAPRDRDRATRLLLLSDGAANFGVRDLPGLRAMATRMRDRGSPISTIGVDVDFDERIMGALANESNGNHYFVADSAGLPAVFEKEFATLLSTVARDAELSIELAPGVEAVQVFDRAFRREGRRIVVPLGDFSAKDEKSALLELRVPADRDGAQPVAQIKIAYRDVMERNDASFAGTVGLSVTSDGSAQAELDPFVRARVERSTTARALDDANQLMNEGRFDEARVRLQTRAAELATAKAAAAAAPQAAPAPKRARQLDQDFDDQATALGNANRSADAAASAAPTDRSRREAPRAIESELQSNPFK